MKKYSIVFFAVAATLFSCSSEKADGAKLGKAVCDCYREGNAMTDKEKQAEKRKECQQLQSQSWNKVMDDEKEAQAFNGQFTDCR